MLPSVTPSSYPTAECHDIASYQGPINNFTCEFHANTDCIQWRYLGLTIEQVEELLNNCPVSCGIECGTVDRLTLLTTFQMYNMSTFLGPESVKIMEEAADEYLTEFVRAAEPQSRFLLTGAELTSQRIVVRRQAPGRYLRINFRSLQESRSVLRVSWSFPYLAIGLDFVDVNQYLREGLESKGFVLALQKSGDAAFRTAFIDYNLHNGTSPSPSTENEGDGDGGPSPGVLAASIILILITGGIGTLFVIFYRRDPNSVRFWKHQEPPVMSSPVQSYQSPPSTSLSFESANNAVTSFVQRMASLSPRSGSTSTDETEDGEEGGNDSKRAPLSTRDSKKELVSMEVVALPEKQEDEEDEVEEEEEHPFTGIIPPMIVIDNIDADRSQQTEPSPGTPGLKAVVPSMRIDASDSFIAALNDRSKPFDPSAFSGVLANSSVVAVDDPGGLMQSLRRQHADWFSSFRVRSSTDEEDNSSSSNHVDTVDGEEVLLDLRHAVSEGATLEAIDASTGAPVTEEVPPSKRGFLAFALKRPPSRADSNSSSPCRSVGSSPCRSIINGSPTPGLADSATTRRDYHSDDELPPIDKKRMHFTYPFFPRNKSPSKQPPTPPPTETTIPSAERPPSERPPRWMLHMRNNSRCSSAGSEGNAGEDDRVLRVFQVPRKGKFGLVIETSSLGGPNVLHVKDYSPLLGLVRPGDQIVDIGGVPTKGMSQKEIIKLLSGKGSHWGPSAIHLTVSRKIEKEKEVFDFASALESSENLPVENPDASFSTLQTIDPPSGG